MLLKNSARSRPQGRNADYTSKWQRTIVKESRFRDSLQLADPPDSNTCRSANLRFTCDWSCNGCLQKLRFDSLKSKRASSGAWEFPVRDSSRRHARRSRTRNRSKWFEFRRADLVGVSGCVDVDSKVLGHLVVRVHVVHRELLALAVDQRARNVVRAIRQLRELGRNRHRVFRIIQIRRNATFCSCFDCGSSVKVTESPCFT